MTHDEKEQVLESRQVIRARQRAVNKLMKQYPSTLRKLVNRQKVKEAKKGKKK